jgi:hypothetical protein
MHLKRTKTKQILHNILHHHLHHATTTKTTKTTAATANTTAWIAKAKHWNSKGLANINVNSQTGDCDTQMENKLRPFVQIVSIAPLLPITLQAGCAKRFILLV